MDVENFRADLLNRAATRASVDGIFTSDAFLEEITDLLVEAEEFDYLDRLSFSGVGRRRQSLAVNGFAHDEHDKSIALAVMHFSGGVAVPTVTHGEAVAALRSLEQYLREALNGDFLIDREPAAPEYQLAQTLKDLRGIGVKRSEETVTRYRLYLVTDARLSARAKAVEPTEIGGTAVEYHIWDMERFLQVHESAQSREPLELELRDWGVEGIPALRVADAVGDTTTYLAAVPGGLLASLYRRHGSRLLEGNVRSFLTIRGKINRGIRETVMKEPKHFLAYNNGISATASGVEYRDGVITKITDLQIVNGGQTTASLFYATQASREVDMPDVFVQMKLVVVSADEAMRMVPLISRFANSQNAVREDDFFSNSPFHVRMEELSKRVLARPKSGMNFQTKWYYERTRGQYLNDRNRRSAVEQRKFEAEFPRSQVITKTDAAKYVVAWERQPHQVSAGAQKNFKAFAALVSDRFAQQPEAFNENYFRRLVAKAILFNSVRAAISKADWYRAGYLANLTAYAIAKLSLEMSKDLRVSTFDLLRLWDNQGVGEAMLAEAVAVGRLALGVLTEDDRLVLNVTEWAKRESAWKRLAGAPHVLSEAFVRECIPITLNSVGKKAVTVNSRFSLDVPEIVHVQEIDELTWRAVRTFLNDKSLLSASEKRCLREVIPMQRGWFDRDDARSILSIYVKALNNGWTEEA